MPRAPLACRLVAALTLALAPFGCAMTANPSAPPLPGPLKSGQWGGVHIVMTVSASRTAIEFDCGTASIDSAIDVDGSGTFSVTGTFQPERPGPTRPDDPPSRPMRLTGTVRGDDMQVSVRLTDQDEDLGSFALTFGAAPRLVKCR